VLYLHRSTMRYRPAAREGDELVNRLRALAVEHPRYGYRMLTLKRQQEGLCVNHKRVNRVYREHSLQLPKRRRKRIRSAKRVPLTLSSRPNERWSMDLMVNMVEDGGGRRLRALTVMDNSSRECLAIDVAPGFLASV